MRGNSYTTSRCYTLHGSIPACAGQPCWAGVSSRVITGFSVIVSVATGGVVGVSGGPATERDFTGGDEVTAVAGQESVVLGGWWCVGWRRREFGGLWLWGGGGGRRGGYERESGSIGQGGEGGVDPAG